ncbi:hydantoinase B/oxoprolinase family protein, partial [Parvibaculum sp.]|uniref:hydantoinase B/oxoprolinase family protein n=1 Tax=Parvibaculum sp. TaxID=2024848 RepID=UPI002D1E1608
GGDGAIRRIRFREPMTVSILSTHRIVPPFGLEGGEAAALGENSVRCADGREEKLSGSDQIELDTGDVIVIKTPGGGGFGPYEL